MEFTQLSTHVKVENQQEFDNGLCMEQQWQNKAELPPPSTYNSSEHSQSNCFDFDTLFPHDQDHDNSPLFYDFNDFEDLNNVDFVLLEDKFKMFYELFHNETKPQAENGATKSLDQNCDHNARSGLSEEVVVMTNVDQVHEVDLFTSKNEERMGEIINGGIRSKSTMLEFDEIQKYFDVPISRAAKEMKVGLTVLKKRCRELNIMRWPHRKIKSLKCLIKNVKEMGLTKEIEMLEEHKRLLEKLPQMELTDKTKKLRQACFKANYKKRRSLAASARLARERAIDYSCY